MSMPSRQGLYDPSFEHDACGLGFVATLTRKPSHEIVSKGLEILANLTHRGAAGSDPLTGDGAGILMQIPHQLFVEEMAAEGVTLPPAGDYAVAMCFFSADPAECRHHQAILEAAVMHHRQKILGWRTPPVNVKALGPSARESMPSFRQLFIGRECSKEAFEQVLCTIRKRAGRNAHFDNFFICSCSSYTIVYKGLMLAEQVAAFYPTWPTPAP